MTKRTIRKALLSLLAVYVLSHLAFIPIISILSRSKHSAKDTPARWQLPCEPLIVKNSLGMKYPGWFIPGAAHKPIVIVLTGSGGNKFGSICRIVARALHDQGYSVFLFDTRGQGESPGIKTFGIGEANDLVHAVDALSRRYPGRKIGAVGFSLGAATVLRAAGMDERLQAVAAYASYSEIDNALIRNELAVQLQGLCKRQGSPSLASTTPAIAEAIVSPLLTRLSLKIWSGTILPLPDPLESVARMKGRSLLLMHNQGDPEIPLRHLEKLKGAAAGRCEVKIFPCAHHEPPLWDAPFKEELGRTLVGFFDRELR
jgi:dienelactone hydrolase